MAHNLIPGNGAHVIGPAVMGIGAVVAHDEVVPFGHGIGGKVRVGSPPPFRVRLRADDDR